MFESDDFDQVLSQFDFSEVPIETAEKSVGKVITNFSNVNNDQENNLCSMGIQIQSPRSILETKHDTPDTMVSVLSKHISSNGIQDKFVSPTISPKHTKRKIINSHFDPKTKRKFPGPAGLLTGTLEENNDETIGHMELLSQVQSDHKSDILKLASCPAVLPAADIEFSQNNLRGDLFECPLWMRLLKDVKLWNLHNIDSIKSIKAQALAGNLTRRKAQIVTAFVETVDRSATDPLIILRDATGHIKCTLHRDAWSNFSTYIVAEFCALVLWKPTVLTTGGAFKKHYLNITLNNIYAIYSSAVIKEEEINLPEGYVIASEDDITVIKTEGTPQDLGTKLSSSNDQSGVSEDNNLLDDLDTMFSDDLF